MAAGQEECWTPVKLLAWTTGYLSEKGIEGARREAEWLLGHATGLSRLDLYLQFDKPLEDAELAVFRSLVSRRGRREPLQYLLGDQEFMGRTFLVTPAVLIPRSDTEVLVEQALKLMPPAARVLDVGTGSGCIAITIACEATDAQVDAVDISAEALAVAQSNAQSLKAGVTFTHGDLTTPYAGKQFDLIVSNPPYIRQRDLAGLQPEVIGFEPVSALDGGADGLDFYRRLIAAAPERLLPGGWLLVEVGYDQAAEVAKLMTAAGFSDVSTGRDGAGIERIVWGGWHGSP